MSQQNHETCLSALREGKALQFLTRIIRSLTSKTANLPHFILCLLFTYKYCLGKKILHLLPLNQLHGNFTSIRVPRESFGMYFEFLSYLFLALSASCLIPRRQQRSQTSSIKDFPGKTLPRWSPWQSSQRHSCCQRFILRGAHRGAV